MDYLNKFTKGGRAFVGNYPILTNPPSCNTETNIGVSSSGVSASILEDCNCEAAGYSSTPILCMLDTVYSLRCHTGEILTCYKPCRGCLDPEAINYDPNATESFGECCYGSSLHRPFLDSSTGCYYPTRISTSVASQDYTTISSYRSVYLSSYLSIKTEICDIFGVISTTYTGRSDTSYIEYRLDNGNVNRTVTSYVDQDSSGNWGGFLMDSYNANIPQPLGSPYIFQQYSTPPGQPQITTTYQYSNN